MIIIHATLVFTSEKDVETFGTSCRGQIEETRKEEGCLAYDFARDLLDPRIVHVAEVYRDEAAVERHRTSPHMRRARETPLAVKPLSVTVKQYGANEIPFKR